MTKPDRWTHTLAPLSAPVRAVLRPWLPHIAARLGPLTARPRTEAYGSPDGVDGLSRRGSWERLLHTSWALADTHPEEFLRRATSAEHLFLNLARERSTATPNVVAWFDAGPDQLGAPRAAQLALWMVLATRTRERDGRLRVGVLQNPERGWSESSGRKGGDFLLEARTVSVPTLAHAAAWRERVQGPTDERWVIGGSRCTPLAARLGARLLCIEEGLGPAPLRVTVDGGSPIALPLPSRAALGGLLHDPWVKARRRARHAPPPLGLPTVVPDSAATHAVSLHRGALIKWSRPFGRSWRRPRVHHSAALGSPSPRYVALGRSRRRAVLLLDRDEDSAITWPNAFVHSGGLQPLFMRPLASGGQSRAHLMTDGAQVLWAHDPMTRSWRCLGELASRPWRHETDLVVHRRGHPFAQRLSYSARAPQADPREDAGRLLDNQRWIDVRPAHGAEHLQPAVRVLPAWPGALVADHGPQALCAILGQPGTLVPRAPGLDLLGALHTAEGWSLVSLASDRRTITLRGALDIDLQPAFATILRAWVSPRDPVLYWTDAAGQIGCVGLPSGRVWLRWSPGSLP